MNQCDVFAADRHHVRAVARQQRDRPPDQLAQVNLMLDELGHHPRMDGGGHLMGSVVLQELHNFAALDLRPQPRSIP